VLTNYLAAIIEAYRWSANPTNRSEAAGIVAKHLKVDPDVAARSVEAAVGALRRPHEGRALRHGGIQDYAQAAGEIRRR